MLSVNHQGRVHRADRLTVDEIDTLEGAATPKIVAALLEAAGADPNQVRWADLTVTDAEDDLPRLWEDGHPTDGGRSMDRYVVAFARPPYCWPPSVTRAQTIRDLSLILVSWEGFR